MKVSVFQSTALCVVELQFTVHEGFCLSIYSLVCGWASVHCSWRFLSFNLQPRVWLSFSSLFMKVSVFQSTASCVVEPQFTVHEGFCLSIYSLVCGWASVHCSSRFLSFNLQPRVWLSFSSLFMKVSVFQSTALCVVEPQFTVHEGFCLSIYSLVCGWASVHCSWRFLSFNLQPCVWLSFSSLFMKVSVFQSTASCEVELQFTVHEGFYLSIYSLVCGWASVRCSLRFLSFNLQPCVWLSFSSLFMKVSVFQSTASCVVEPQFTVHEGFYLSIYSLVCGWASVHCSWRFLSFNLQPCVWLSLSSLFMKVSVFQSTASCVVEPQFTVHEGFYLSIYSLVCGWSSVHCSWWFLSFNLQPCVWLSFSSLFMKVSVFQSTASCVVELQFTVHEGFCLSIYSLVCGWASVHCSWRFLSFNLQPCVWLSLSSLFMKVSVFQPTALCVVELQFAVHEGFCLSIYSLVCGWASVHCSWRFLSFNLQPRVWLSFSSLFMKVSVFQSTASCVVEPQFTVHEGFYLSTYSLVCGWASVHCSLRFLSFNLQPCVWLSLSSLFIKVSVFQPTALCVVELQFAVHEGFCLSIYSLVCGWASVHCSWSFLSFNLQPCVWLSFSSLFMKVSVFQSTVSCVVELQFTVHEDFCLSIYSLVCGWASVHCSWRFLSFNLQRRVWLSFSSLFMKVSVFQSTALCVVELQFTVHEGFCLSIYSLVCGWASVHCSWGFLSFNLQPRVWLSFSSLFMKVSVFQSTASCVVELQFAVHEGFCLSIYSLVCGWASVHCSWSFLSFNLQPCVWLSFSSLFMKVSVFQSTVSCVVELQFTVHEDFCLSIYSLVCGWASFHCSWRFMSFNLQPRMWLSFSSLFMKVSVFQPTASCVVSLSSLFMKVYVFQSTASCVVEPQFTVHEGFCLSIYSLVCGWASVHCSWRFLSFNLQPCVWLSFSLLFIKVSVFQPTTSCVVEPQFTVHEGLCLSIYSLVCGWASVRCSLRFLSFNLQPRVWLSLSSVFIKVSVFQPTASCVVEPQFTVLEGLCLSIYSLVCGWASVHCSWRFLSFNLQPCVWLSFSSLFMKVSVFQPTASCVVEPQFTVHEDFCLSIYSLVCGWASVHCSWRFLSFNLQPRVWLSLSSLFMKVSVFQSTASCVVEPQFTVHEGFYLSIYSLVCGWASVHCSWRFLSFNLQPRVWLSLSSLFMKVSIFQSTALCVVELQFTVHEGFCLSIYSLVCGWASVHCSWRFLSFNLQPCVWLSLSSLFMKVSVFQSTASCVVELQFTVHEGFCLSIYTLVCGWASVHCSWRFQSFNLQPRVWLSFSSLFIKVYVFQSTALCVVEPQFTVHEGLCLSIYSLVCGWVSVHCSWRFLSFNLQPRVWLSFSSLFMKVSVFQSTALCVVEPQFTVHEGFCLSIYSLVCGWASVHCSWRFLSFNLQPCVWLRLSSLFMKVSVFQSTASCVVELQFTVHEGFCLSIYSLVCGWASVRCSLRFLSFNLQPRVWLSLSSLFMKVSVFQSTALCVVEPQFTVHEGFCLSIYSLVCGWASVHCSWRFLSFNLQPRVWLSFSSLFIKVSVFQSTALCVFEPQFTVHEGFCLSIYSLVCGWASVHCSWRFLSFNLQPRVWLSFSSLFMRISVFQSTASCVVEPHFTVHEDLCLSIYSLVCGWASVHCSWRFLSFNLQPRVWLSLSSLFMKVSVFQSTASCVVEPQFTVHEGFCLSTYSLVCGWASVHCSWRFMSFNLQPRVWLSISSLFIKVSVFQPTASCVVEPQIAVH